MINFLMIAALAGIGIALIAGPLGTFVVWRRMAYLGDTLAHSALLGVSLGVVLSLNINITVVMVCIALALLIVFLQYRQNIATDTLLGIMAHGSLAVGLVTIALFAKQSVDLNSYLFGDLLATSLRDVIWIYSFASFILLILVLCWRRFLCISVNEDLAQVEGINVAAMKTLLMVLTAITIALAMKAVGVLLITALLIIPAATARRYSTTPEHMAFIAAFLGALSVVGGLAQSYYFDTPAGPSIVVTATVLYIVSFAKKAA